MTRDDLPSEYIMRQMAKVAMEQATTFFANMADQFARTLPPDATGEQAMLLFAAAIRSQNAKTWPTPPVAS